MTDTTEPQAVPGAQEARRVALIERIGTIADLACTTPLAGELGDVAYDLLRQAAAQLSSDRQHITRIASVSSASAEGIEACIALCDRMENDESLPDQAVYAAWNLKVGMLHLLKRASASPEPVPATNKAGEVEDARARLIAEIAAKDAMITGKGRRSFVVDADDRTVTVNRQALETVLSAALATQPATLQEEAR